MAEVGGERKMGRHEAWGMLHGGPCFPGRALGCRATGLASGGPCRESGNDESGGGGVGIALVFELFDHAFGGGDVAAPAAVNRLIDAAAFPEGVEVLRIDHVANGGDLMVRRNGDVAGGNHGFAIVEAERHAASGIDGGDHKRGAFDELELQLRSAGVGASGAVGCVEFLEHDALAAAFLQLLEGGELVIEIDGGADPTERGQVWRDGGHQPREPVHVALHAQAAAVEFEQVENMERVAHGFAIDEDIDGNVFDGFTDGPWDGDDEATAVDAGDFIALLADHQAAAVVFLLEAEVGRLDERADLGVFDGVEQLAADAGVGALVAALLIDRRRRIAGAVTLGDLGLHQLVEGLGGFVKRHRMRGFRSGGERAAASSVGEGHEVTLAFRFDGGVIDLVGGALAEMERGGLDGGGGGLHGVWGLVGGLVREWKRQCRQIPGWDS